MKATYVDHMGSDKRVVNAARISFNLAEGDTITEQDKRLIRFLASGYTTGEWQELVQTIKDIVDDETLDLALRELRRHAIHFTPFTHPQITLREEVPIFVARQRFKSTIGFSYNEVSRRYVSAPAEFYRPDKWRAKADNKKQGSLDIAVANNEELKEQYENWIMMGTMLYQKYLDDGVCPEQARMLLPQSMITEYYVTGSLAAWARIYNLRHHATSQKEIRWLASHWDEVIRPLFPVSWAALVD